MEIRADTRNLKGFSSLPFEKVFPLMSAFSSMRLGEERSVEDFV